VLLEPKHRGAQVDCHCLPPGGKVKVEGTISQLKGFKVEGVVFGAGLNVDVEVNGPVIQAMVGKNGSFYCKMF